MPKKDKQFLTNIGGLLIKLIEHITVVCLYYLALKILLILGNIIFPDPDPWPILFIVLIKCWFLIVFAIYVLDDIIKYYKERFRNRK